ncbi:PLB2 [Candida theae]|uniref:Lysophospholipase n=1 Tax=Candida theae TaxID=1198502 RepID=A0AAD5BFI1_9ASCO|nr:PLB2 [Candida theae]KAI5959214.1 PLB2 [Candida theae]
MFFLVLLPLIGIIAASSSSHGYAPVSVSCPGGQLTRSSLLGLNPDEKRYVDQRYTDVAKPNLRSFLAGANLTDFDADSFLDQANPTIGITFSGGGYRAQLSGAGQYAALDSRTNVVNGKGLGGILQSASYISGLSGGSWLLGSLVSNNLISIDELIDQNTLWQLQNSLLTNGGDIANHLDYWNSISDEVEGKKNAGFDVTITDVYSRALSYQLLTNSPYDGAGYAFSSIINQSNFQSFQAPYPILVALGREPGQSVINLNSTVMSLTPFELGSEDPSLQSFVQTKYVGTQLDNGYSNNISCVNGFDNAGFFMGTSSSLFNGVVLTLDSPQLPPFLRNLINTFIVNPFERLNVDVSHYVPNPFYKSRDAKNSIERSDSLFLVDGGEDGQNVPLVPLLRRNLSAIFAFDNSNDHLTWPDGTSLIKTYERQFSPQGKGTPFPYVPDQKTFRNLNLTAKPTFFGCDAKNLSSLTSDIYDVPLVIYTANRPYTYWSNTSTFRLEYQIDERNNMIANGFAATTRLNGTLDEEWDACVGCAVIRREQERLGVEQSEQCKQCFQRYCWDGTIYEGEPIGDNFDDNGLTVAATYYNAQNVPGFHNTGPNIKRDQVVIANQQDYRDEA